MLISNKGKKFLTGRQISYLCCLWARPGSNIFKNFFNKKFLDLSLEYTLNSAGHSENIDFFRSLSNREVVGCRNSGKFLKKFFENQRLFQWLFVKSTKISDKNLNIWNFSEFLQNLKIFVNKNTIKMENIKVPPINEFFQWHFSATF